MNDLVLIRAAIILSVLIYFIFDYFDKKTIVDEREELIRLKTYALMQKLTLWAVTIVVAIFVLDPSLPAIYPILAIIMTSLYGEIFGKLYFRRKL